MHPSIGSLKPRRRMYLSLIHWQAMRPLETAKPSNPRKSPRGSPRYRGITSVLVNPKCHVATIDGVGAPSVCEKLESDAVPSIDLVSSV